MTNAAAIEIDSSLGTQYIVLSGREGVSDIPRIIAKLKLPADVVISYRHTSVADTLFLSALFSEFRNHGVRSVSTIFSSSDESKRIRLIAQHEGIAFTAN